MKLPELSVVDGFKIFLLSIIACLAWLVLGLFLSVCFMLVNEGFGLAFAYFVGVSLWLLLCGGIVVLCYSLFYKAFCWLLP